MHWMYMHCMKCAVLLFCCSSWKGHTSTTVVNIPGISHAHWAWLVNVALLYRHPVSTHFYSRIACRSTRLTNYFGQKFSYFYRTYENPGCTDDGWWRCDAEHDASVTYIDDDDEDDPSLPLYHTMPYVCGKVLLASVLDSLVAAVSRQQFSIVYPFDNHCCHMGTAIKHSVLHRVKPSFAIFDIRVLCRSGLSVRVPGCQKLQMTA